MTTSRVASTRSRNRKRVYAIAAAGTVLAASVTIPSLAAWTDNEWIAGGVANEDGTGGDNGGGVSTSTFEVQQRANGDAAFGDYESEAGANVIDFTEQAAQLTLGDTVYAWVDLKTTDESLGGTLELVAETVTAGNPLAEALRYGASIVTDAAACDAAGFAAGTVLQASGTALDVSAGTEFSLAAEGAETKTVCFQLTLPGSASNDLQGQTVTPIWRFAATSVA